MAQYRASIETQWTPDEAFVYLSDFSTSLEWDPSVVEAERIGAGPVGQGTEFRLVAELLGRKTPLTYRVVEYERPSVVTFVAENATVISRDGITFETISTGTRVTYDAHLRPNGLLRLADPLLALAFNRIGNPALAGRREVLGRSAPGAAEAAA
jgi:hypothetical protein